MPKRIKPQECALTNDEILAAYVGVAAIDTEVVKGNAREDPVTYGMPNLLRAKRPEETVEEFRIWREHELKTFIEARLWIDKDGRRINIVVLPEMKRFLVDLFYGYVDKAILWKSRGGGGSLAVAILIWLKMIYQKMSFTDMAGSAEQAKIVYAYTKQFWKCIPGISELLQGNPLQTETRMVNGVMLKTVAASEKQARGKHVGGFIADESCQGSEGVDDVIRAGLQGSMSESVVCIVLLSTFHYPIGLFQETWDFAEERGFARYNWNVFHTMASCTAGLDTATPEDPQALHYCRTQCDLTEIVSEYDESGNRAGEKLTGCRGAARTSCGWQPRKNVLITKKLNRGTNIFYCEYENQRPNWMRPVYDVTWVERALIESMTGDFRLVSKSIGIDWGLEGQTCICLLAKLRDSVVVLETEFMTGKLTDEVIALLRLWVNDYGMPEAVFPDQSHPYNNLELSNAGFNVIPVAFNKWKEYGIGNAIKYFVNGRIRILDRLTGFIEQIKRYRRDKFGRPIKKEDHGPDALMCGLLHFRFEDHFGKDLEVTEQGEKEILPMAIPMAEGVRSPTDQVQEVSLMLPLVGTPVVPKRKIDVNKDQVLLF